MDWPTVFLGVIGLATIVMAVLQVAVFVFGARLAQRIDRLVHRVEHDIKPALERVNAVSGDINRMSELAVAQAERTDQLLKDVTERVDRITLLAQDAVVEPMRQAPAVLRVLWAAVDALRSARTESSSSPKEDEASSTDQTQSST